MMADTPETQCRARLVQFIEPWIDSSYHARMYEPRVGDPGLGEKLSLWNLTDSALERIAYRICRDFWSDKKVKRENKARAAALKKFAREAI